MKNSNLSRLEYIIVENNYLSVSEKTELEIAKQKLNSNDPTVREKAQQTINDLREKDIASDQKVIDACSNGNAGSSGCASARLEVIAAKGEYDTGPYNSKVSQQYSDAYGQIVNQSSSAAGKSSLMEAVLGLMPDEERVQYSAMTGQSLYYLGETSLQHKILAIAEEEGVRQAAYALKLLQSDGALTIASTGKNEQSGELVTREYSVQGPVMLMLTTTAIDVDEELLNRCLVLTVNESQEQTQAIHAMQRHVQTLEGLLAVSEKPYLTQLHRNAQRLLRPLKVVNPYAHQLTFLSDKTRTRRDHMKYLTLIQAVALLHQYQREVKRATHRGQVIEYIEVTKDDIALATRLAHEVLGRTLDEMPPQTRKLLVLLKAEVHTQAQRQGMKPDELRFTRRDVRDWLRWGDTQLKIHLGRLLELEYLQLNRRGLTHEYQLLWDGEDNHHAHLCGLPDVESLTSIQSETEGSVFRSGPEPSRSASGRDVVALYRRGCPSAQSRRCKARSHNRAV